MQKLENSETSTGLDIQASLFTWLEVMVAESSTGVGTEIGAPICGLSI